MLTSSRPRLRASLLKTSFLPLLLPQKTQILRNRFEGATLPITDVSSFSDGFRVADCIPTSVSWMVMSRLPMLVLQLLPGTASKTPAAKNSEVFCADMHTKPRHLSLSQKAKKLNVWTGSFTKTPPHTLIDVCNSKILSLLYPLRSNIIRQALGQLTDFTLSS